METADKQPEKSSVVRLSVCRRHCARRSLPTPTWRGAFAVSCVWLSGQGPEAFPQGVGQRREPCVVLLGGPQDAAVLGGVLGGNFTQDVRDRILGGAAGPGDVLNYPSQHLALLLVGLSAPGVARIDI
jgi:hypothetical protein